uniref:Putative ovule protein n=1 Tax=Solanum chacoense TaxID=4108 RepID=A0A0V0HFI6_SOLCH
MAKQSLPWLLCPLPNPWLWESRTLILILKIFMQHYRTQYNKHWSLPLIHDGGDKVICSGGRLTPSSSIKVFT